MKKNSQLISFPDGITLESGYFLNSFDLMIESYGELNESKSNAILVCHAFSGNHHIAGEDKEFINKFEECEFLFIDKLIIYYKQPNVRLDYINAHVYVNH